MAGCEELVQCPPGYKLGITDENFQALEGLVERKKTHIEVVINLMKMVWFTESRTLLKSSALVLFYAVILGFILHERLASVEALVLAILCFLLTALYTVDSALRMFQYRRLFELVYDLDKVLIRQMNHIRRGMMVEEEVLRVGAGAGEEASLSEWSKSLVKAHLVECICKQIARPLTEYWGCSRVWLIYYWIALYGGFLCMHYPFRYILSY